MSAAQKPWEFVIYMTNLGIFFRNPWGSPYNNYSSNPENIKSIRINGVTPVNHLHNGYFFLENIFRIEKFERMSHAKSVFSHMQLIDDSYASDKIPLRYENVTYDYDSETEQYLSDNEELNKLISLYKPIYKQIEGAWEEHPFTVSVVGNLIVENVTEPVKMKVKLADEGAFSSKVSQNEVDISQVTDYYAIEKMLTPPFVLHQRNCFISSDNMYRIVRNYVKLNIDPKQAQITSDYDFCFTVKKLVKVKPYTIRKEVLTSGGNSYRPPRYKNIENTTKLVEVFEMTSASKKYNNYTVIQPLKAENQEELVNNLKRYLDELMEVINQEVAECPHCQGCGHVVGKAKTNSF